MKRKITLLLTAVLITAALIGCTRAGGSNPDGEITLTQFRTTQHTSVAATAEPSTTTEKAATTAKTTAETTAKKTTTTSAKEAATTKHTTTKAAAKTTAKHKKKAARTTKKQRTTAHKTTTASRQKSTTKPTTGSRIDKTKITVTIQCKEVLSNLDKLAEGHEYYVPKNGFFIVNYPVEFSKGDTVYDVLRQACRENNIKLRAKQTAYGMYVVGINELDEKDCGAASGWTYYVNGDFPMHAVDKHTLTGGEYVEFKYVV